MNELLLFLSSIEAPGPSRIKKRPLSGPLQDYLQKALKFKEFKKGDLLLKAGQTSRHMCFVEKGFLRCYLRREDGKEVNTWFMSEGDVICAIRSFHTQRPGEEYIEALEPGSLYYITYDELDEIYYRFPEFERVGRLLTEKYHMLWDERLSAILATTARERYEWLISQYPQLLDRTYEKHVASWLGITDVTLSRIKNK